MPAEYIPFGEPENESERMAINYLRGHLPNSYKIFANLEIKQGVEIFEIDLIILAPHCVYVVDIKNWRGRIEIYDRHWYPENYQPYPSPLKKLRKHAKVISSTICDTNRALQQHLSRVHIQATVLMTSDDVEVIDKGDKDGDHVTYLDKRCLDYFQSVACVPPQRLTIIKPYVNYVEKAIRGKSQPKTSPHRYLHWQVEEKLGGNDRYTEYRAVNQMIGTADCTVRLRVYKVDPLLEPVERAAQHKLIGTAFLAVFKIPRHPNILPVRDCFISQTDDGIVLVTDDVPGQALSQHLKKHSLNLEQKISIIRDVLRALEHVHKHGVIHRNITPDSILIAADEQASLTSFDYARVPSHTSTIADEIAEDLAEYAVYQAVECQNDPSQASIQSDLFSAGLVFYTLLTGVAAFEDANQISEENALFPVKPSERNSELSPAWDIWLQKLCAFAPQDRFPDAGTALQEFSSLVSNPISSVPVEESSLDGLDITNLLPNTLIDERYQIIKRLGRPGSFGVAYQVFDTLGEVERVLKLVTKDRYSVYERLQQEYKTLQKVPKHPHIVEVIWAGQLKDDTPFIVFEYVQGQDVQHLIETKAISVKQSIEIVAQTAVGLSHLHEHKVCHQDIKPSNLLVTDTGVRIIDFNVAVSDGDEIVISAGTRRYLPPDCKLTSSLTLAEKIDRDLYALGIVFYECVTGCYPFDEPQPPKKKLPRDPREVKGCENLDGELVKLLMRAIAPQRSKRFSSAEEFLAELGGINRRGAEVAEEREERGDGEREISLFEVPIRNEVNGDKPVVLDPTELYEIPPGYTAIATEVDWMRSFGVSGSPWWVKGKRLCDWAVEWLQVWNRMDEVAEIKPDPKVRLQSLFGSLPLPQEWSDKQILALVTRLDSYPQENPIARLLADVLGHEEIWFGEASITHLATWLTVRVPQECKPLEKVWQQQFQDCDLATYYLTEDKFQLLRCWLGIAKPSLTELGKYSLDIPDIIAQEFDRYWEQQMYLTQGEVLKHLPPHQAGMERIASIALKVAKQRPNWSDRVKETGIAVYLSYQQKQELQDLQSPTQPELLPLDASPSQALTWVTQSYLPFRRWEVISQPLERRTSERLADSFVEWMLLHYPQMKVDSVENSYLNYSVASPVRDLCQSGPVLWVVVDGLGWLDHMELLSILSQNHQLAVEKDIEPRFSILPTKTEYAKGSLYSQLLPNSSAWEKDSIKKAFAKMGLGEHYTDNRIDRLRKDLRKRKHKLYCWDTTQFDELHHNSSDWQHLYNIKRPYTLELIAREIVSFVEEYPNPEELRVAIASDHGQILGTSEKITCPRELEPQGRIAIGKTTDPRFVVLESDRYGLPNDISVVRSSATISSFNYNSDKKILGSHGGLFPEEVVVGFSVLKKTIQRSPVIITCHGEGEAGKPGRIEITIDNSNSVPLTDLYLYIKELPSFDTKKPLEKTIPANQRVSFQLTIPKTPELSLTHESDRLPLSGELTFKFAGRETNSANLTLDSQITITQMFISQGFNIDEFL